MNPSWDLFIVLSFVVMGIYGYLLGRGRVFGILMNSYVGLVVATALGSYAFDYLSKITDLSHSFYVSLFGAKVFTFVAVVFILTLNKELSSSNSDTSSSPIYTATYGLLAAGLILSSVFSFMSASDRATLFASSNLAQVVYTYQLLWLVGPIAVILASSVLNKFRR